jgi:hypothetical protein
MTADSPGHYHEIEQAARDTDAYEAACTAYFVTARRLSEAERHAAAVAALLAVRPDTPRDRAAQIAGWMVPHAKRKFVPRWMEPERWAARERVKAAGLAVTLGELADHGFEIAATCPGCERTRSGQLAALTGRHGRAALLDALRRKLRCRNCGSKAIAIAVIDAPLAPPPAQKPWSDRERR